VPILPLFRGAWSAAMLKVEVGKQLTPVDTEPRFTRELKAIRDKKERLFRAERLGRRSWCRSWNQWPVRIRRDPG
jgi:hypothetical protein